MLTESLAYLCPNAHGKVRLGMDRQQLRARDKRWELLEFLDTLPEATKIEDGRGWLIGGERHVRRTRPVAVTGEDGELIGEDNTSVLEPGDTIPEGLVGARVGERAYLFARVS